MLANDDFHVHADVAGTADNFQNASGGRNPAPRKSRYLRIHNRTIKLGKPRSAACMSLSRSSQVSLAIPASIPHQAEL